MEKKAKSKLKLHKETLRTLGASELRGAAGGTDSRLTNCIVSDCVCNFTLYETCLCTEIDC